MEPIQLTTAEAQDVARQLGQAGQLVSALRAELATKQAAHDAYCKEAAATVNLLQDAGMLSKSASAGALNGLVRDPINALRMLQRQAEMAKSAGQPVSHSIGNPVPQRTENRSQAALERLYADFGIN